MSSPTGPDLEAALLHDRLRLDLARVACVIAADRLAWIVFVDNVESFRADPSELDPLQVLADPLDRAGSPSEGLDQLNESLDWLVAEGVLDAPSRDAVQRLRSAAIDASTRLPSLLLEQRIPPEAVVADVVPILETVERFFARIDIDAMPEFDGQDISDDDITANFASLLQTMVDAAWRV